MRPLAADKRQVLILLVMNHDGEVLAARISEAEVRQTFSEARYQRERESLSPAAHCRTVQDTSPGV